MSAVLQHVEDFVRAEFSAKLPSELTYHSPEHTIMVVENCKLLARESGIDDKDTEIVLIAAWMHDIGFTVRYKGHEEDGCAIATMFLTSEHYPPSAIEKVLGCIRATEIPQRPNTLLENIVCDADLLYLGTDGYQLWSDCLRTEQGSVQHRFYSDAEWQDLQLNFLRSLQYRTPYALNVFQPKLQAHVIELEKTYFV